MTEHPDMEGFDAFVDEQIVPLFSHMQTTRDAGKAQLKKGGWIGLLVGLGVGLSIFVFFQSWPWALAALVLAPLIGMAPGFLLASSAEGTFMDENVALVSKFLGLEYQEKDFDPPHFDLLTRARLVPEHDRSKFTELVQGERHGVPFALYEASLKQRIESGSGKNKTVTWVPVFFGQFLHIPYHRSFSSHTLVARDAGFLNKFSGPGMGLKRVGLVDPEFEDMFEVYSTDQVEGRYLVDPLFMERLLKLEAYQKDRELQAAFFEQSVMIAVTGGDGFYPTMSDGQNAKDVALETANVFLSIFDLIDGVLGKSKKV